MSKLDAVTRRLVAMRASIGWTCVVAAFCILGIATRVSCLTTTCSQQTTTVCSETANSYCDMYAGRCRCKVGYFEDGDQCHSELGSPCSNPGEPCTAIVGSLCDPVKSACRCSTNWRQINLNTCYEPPAEKSQLKYVPALAKGAYVNELNEGHKAGDAKVVSDLDVKSIFRQWLRRMSRLFTQRSAVGSKCSVNTLCVVKYSKCSELGICECQYGFYQRNGKCLPGLRNKCILIGQPCYNIPNSLCSKSYICSCKPGYIQANDHCEPANSLRRSRRGP